MTKDIVKEKAELVLDALNYAHEHKLDIYKKEDVQKILEALDPEHSSEEEIIPFMELLQSGDMFIEKSVKKMHQKEKRLPN